MNLKGAIDLSCRALPMIARHRTTMSAASAWRRKNITKATGGTDRAEPRRGLQAASHNDRIQGYLERAWGGFWSWGGCHFERLFQHVLRKKKAIEVLTSFATMVLEPTTISHTEVRH